MAERKNALARAPETPAGLLATDQKNDSMPQQSDFDRAFSELDAALIDLDGDGVPDVQVPRNALMDSQSQPQRANALMGGVPDYGFGPVTPQSREGYMPQGEMRSYNPQSATDRFFEYGSAPARGVVDQFDRAGTAVAGAVEDPSLANVTNAGVQSALAVGRPVAAGGMLAAGMLEGARRDYAPELFPSADAQSLTRKQQRQMEMERQRMQAETDAQRQRSQDAANVAVETERKRKEQAEYDRSVQNAEAARDAELGRKRRFSDTQLGKVYEATGGAAPMAAAFGMGALGRLAHGGNALGRYVLPAAEGAVTGVSVSSLPLLYDATLTDPDNPDKAAYQAYSRELPPGHPRKKEFLDYANTLPDSNPLRATAREEFMSPERWLMGGIEGAGLGIAGSTAASVPSRAGNALMRFGRSDAEAPAVQVVTRSSSGTYHGPDGRFVSPPRRNR